VIIYLKSYESWQISLRLGLKEERRDMQDQASKGRGIHVTLLSLARRRSFFNCKKDMMDPDEYDPAFRIGAHGAADEDDESSIDVDTWLSYSVGALANIQGSLSADVLALPGMKEAISDLCT